VASIATDDPDPAVAFAIGRRTGNAVVRNRIRRRMREILRESALPGYRAYLFGAGASAAGLDAAELRGLLAELVDQLRIES